jgi:hypothetical protein
MSLVSGFKALFKSTKGDAIPVVVFDAFARARSRYEESQGAVKPHTGRAKRRAIVFRAQQRFEQTKDRNAFDKEVSDFTDAKDFAAYTEDELDAHTSAMENLATEFENFTAAFVDLRSATRDTDSESFIEAQACFNVYCEAYKIAVDAYKIATLFAIANAAQAKAQAVKEAARRWLKDITIDPDAKVKKSEKEVNAEMLQQKAKLAEAKAELFIAKSSALWEE